MSVLSTLRNSSTQLSRTRVTWHPLGITAVRVFTIEPCAAIPKRRLKRKPSSLIKNANSEEATPFTVIPKRGLKRKQPSLIKNANPEEATPFTVISELEPEPRIIVQEALPKKPRRCQTHTMAQVQGWLQQLGGGVDINHSYMDSELPLSFKEELYDYQKNIHKKLWM